MSNTIDQGETHDTWATPLTADGAWHRVTEWAGELVVITAYPRNKYVTSSANYRGKCVGPVHSAHGGDLIVVDLSDPDDSHAEPLLLALLLSNIVGIRAWDPSVGDYVAGVERQVAR